MDKAPAPAGALFCLFCRETGLDCMKRRTSQGMVACVTSDFIPICFDMVSGVWYNHCET